MPCKGCEQRQKALALAAKKAAKAVKNIMARKANKK